MEFGLVYLEGSQGTDLECSLAFLCSVKANGATEVCSWQWSGQVRATWKSYHGEAEQRVGL